MPVAFEVQLRRMMDGLNGPFAFPAPVGAAGGDLVRHDLAGAEVDAPILEITCGELFGQRLVDGRAVHCARTGKLNRNARYN